FAVTSAAATPLQPKATVQEPEQEVQDPSGLVVTEILPNTTSHDEFEYFEIHNASEAAINLDEAGYSFAYSYDDSANQDSDVPLSISEDEAPVVLAPGETVVMWLNYTADNIDSFSYTVDEFREFYGMADDNDARIVRVEGQP